MGVVQYAHNSISFEIACPRYLLVWFFDFGYTARQDYFTHFEPSQSVGGAKTGDPLLVWKKSDENNKEKVETSFSTFKLNCLDTHSFNPIDPKTFLPSHWCYI